MANSSQYIFINSKDRIYGTSSNFGIDLNDQSIDDNVDMSLCVQNISIPNSFYNVNANNYSIATGTTVVNLTQGSYNVSNFINNFISNASTVIPGISVSYTSTTAKYTFGASGSFDLTGNTNQQYLGLSPGVHTSNGSNQIVSDEIVNMSQPMEIRVLTDIPVYSQNSTTNNQDVLISIYPKVSFGSIINYTNQDFSHIKLKSPRIGL